MHTEGRRSCDSRQRWGDVRTRQGGLEPPGAGRGHSTECPRPQREPGPPRRGLRRPPLAQVRAPLSREPRGRARPRRSAAPSRVALRGGCPVGFSGGTPHGHRPRHTECRRRPETLRLPGSSFSPPLASPAWPFPEGLGFSHSVRGVKVPHVFLWVDIMEQIFFFFK